MLGSGIALTPQEQPGAPGGIRTGWPRFTVEVRGWMDGMRMLELRDRQHVLIKDVKAIAKLEVISRE